MAEFTFDASGLSPWLRETAAKHFEQTRHMCFGGRERLDALFFRLPYDHPDVMDTSPPAAVLRDLAAQFRGGGLLRVKLGGLDKSARARLSALLEQTQARAGRDGQDELAGALGRLWRQWDATTGVPAGEYERQELVQYSGRAPARPAPSRIVGA